MMITLFLLPETWDLTLDAQGNIAVASDVYQQAQDIATAGRTFLGDLYYNKGEGIPYFEHVLGTHGFPLSLYKMYLEESAMSVPGIVSANARLSLVDRQAVGTIEFTNENGQEGSIAL